MELFPSLFPYAVTFPPVVGTDGVCLHNFVPTGGH
jgi:hypothetical protein